MQLKSYYDTSDYLTLDIFKGISFFKNLEIFNSSIYDITKKVTYRKDWNYDVNLNEAAFWFDADQVRNTPLPKDYPKIDPIQLDSRFNLILHIANYMSLLIIYYTHKDNREILIEDMCCGMGNLMYYLTKLGYTNFSLLDNFSQLPKFLFDETISLIKKETKNFKFSLNNFDAKPKIFNLVAYPHYIKRDSLDQEIIPDSIDLFLSYLPLEPNTRHLSINNNKFFKTYRCLAKDDFRMIWAYCKADKYDLYTEKLQEISK